MSLFIERSRKEKFNLLVVTDVLVVYKKKIIMEVKFADNLTLRHYYNKTNYAEMSIVNCQQKLVIQWLLLPQDLGESEATYNQKNLNLKSVK